MLGFFFFVALFQSCCPYLLLFLLCLSFKCGVFHQVWKLAVQWLFILLELLPLLCQDANNACKQFVFQYSVFISKHSPRWVLGFFFPAMFQQSVFDHDLFIIMCYLSWMIPFCLASLCTSCLCSKLKIAFILPNTQLCHSLENVLRALFCEPTIPFSLHLFLGTQYFVHCL